MKAKRSISGRILLNTLVMMICLAVVFVVLMTRSMKSLTDSVLSDVKRQPRIWKATCTCFPTGFL